MSLQIADGKGGAGLVEVRGQKLVTLTHAHTPLAAASLDGRAYAISNVTYTPSAADTLVAIRNDHASKNFHICSVIVQTDIASEIQCHLITAAYTNAGTSITPVNLNTNFGNSSNLLCTGDETGNTQGSIIAHWNQVAAAVLPFTFYDWGGSVILGPDHAFGVDTVVNIGAGVYVTVTGYQAE